MSNDDNRRMPFKAPSADDPVWSAKSVADRADRIRQEEQSYADLLDTLKQIRNQFAHKDFDYSRALRDEAGEHVIESTMGSGESRRKGRQSTDISGFEFSSVGSVDAAMHIARPFSSGPVLQILSASAPHELAALRERAIKPERLGLGKPEDFSDEEYANVISTYAGAELLDRERRFNETMAQKAHSREGWKMFLQVAIPIVTLVLGSIATYFGMKD